jgi:hypothetical protein
MYNIVRFSEREARCGLIRRTEGVGWNLSSFVFINWDCGA